MKKTLKWTRLLGFLMLLMLALPMVASADDDGPEWRGTIESRPTGSVIGDWQINGRSFVVRASTQIDYEDGNLALGSCAKAKYFVSGGQNIATKLEGKSCNNDGCDDRDGGDCGGDDGGGDNGDHNGTEVSGIVSAFPAGLIGTWVVDGVSYTANNTTSFEQEHGSFAIGGCVNVRYNPTTMVASRIEVDDHCGGNGGGDNDGGTQVRGTLESFPAGLIGTWVVDGVSYTATNATQFEQNDGAFVIGACVKVRYNPTTLVASKIETKHNCGGNGGGGGDNDGGATQYGVVDSFPAGLVGSWVIAGVSYTADNTTQFNQHDGPFVVGGCVKVRYNPVTLVATEIETDNNCGSNGGGGGDDGNSYTRVYGAVESFPAGLIGTWVVNGVSYSASNSTQFSQEHGTFAVGACVKVDYVPATFAAIEIEIADAYHCGGNGGGGGHDDGDLKRYGAIETFPAGLIGTWTIDGIAYEAGNGTQFQQEHGVFATGVCAEVSYLAGTPNIALKIETADAYHCGGNGGGGGDDGGSTGSYQSLKATVDSFPAGLLGDWVIGGVTYAADATTIFKQEHGVFATGACVEVTFQTANNLALEISTENAYHCGTGTTPPTDPTDPTVDVNHGSGADGSAFVFAGSNLPANSTVSIIVGGLNVGTALTNSEGWVTFAVEATESRTVGGRGIAATYAVALEVNGSTAVSAPSVTIDNTQPLLGLPSNYSAPVVSTVLIPTAVGLNQLSTSVTNTTLFALTALLLVAATGVVVRRKED